MPASSKGLMGPSLDRCPGQPHPTLELNHHSVSPCGVLPRDGFLRRAPPKSAWDKGPRKTPGCELTANTRRHPAWTLGPDEPICRSPLLLTSCVALGLSFPICNSTSCRVAGWGGGALRSNTLVLMRGQHSDPTGTWEFSDDYYSAPESRRGTSPPHTPQVHQVLSHQQ